MHIEKNLILPGAAGKPIALDLFCGEGKRRPVVIYAHGFNGFKDWGNFDLIARQFAEAGFAFVKFNFSHNGTSPEKPEEFVDPEAYGNNNYSKELDDLQTVINWVREPANPQAENMDGNHLFLIGHSRGGGMVLIKGAEEKSVKGIATWASVGECKTPWGNWPPEKLEEWKATGVQNVTNSRTRQQLPVYYQLYEDFQLHKDRFNIKEAVRHLNVPLLICHGSRDEAVPVSRAYELKEAALDARLLILESDHVFGRKHPWTEEKLPEAMQQVVSETIAFFRAIADRSAFAAV